MNNGELRKNTIKIINDYYMKEFLLFERSLLIYDFDKVKPKDRARYEEIQQELMRLENDKLD